MQLFLTGGTGFIGARLLEELLDRGHEVRVLTRRDEDLPAGATPVRGDLLESASYEAALDGCEAVLHLAAATGSATSREHERVNREGTQALVGACRRHGAPDLLFLSSIAVTFPDLRDYPYARSKAAAEEAVRGSGLEYLVLRPTAVFGPGSATFAGLWRLAGLPVTPLFQGGAARIQPIHVDDLVRQIADAVESRPLGNVTRTVGGPEVVTMRDMLLRLRRRRGRRPAAIAIPLAPVLPVLRALEKLAPGRLPVTAGQLTSFRFDGVVEPRREANGPGEQLGIDAMVESSVA